MTTRGGSSGDPVWRWATVATLTLKPCSWSYRSSALRFVQPVAAVRENVRICFASRRTQAIPSPLPSWGIWSEPMMPPYGVPEAVRPAAPSRRQ
jgi:hypothetical protein